MNRDFKGVWISKEIWINSELTWMEKLVLVEIDSLDNEKGCFAGNDYFERFFNLKERRVRQIIKDLKDKGYISANYIYKDGTKQIEKRVLKVLKRGEAQKCHTYGTKVPEGGAEKCRPPMHKSAGGGAQKCRDNNTVNNTSINNTSECNTREEKFFDSRGNLYLNGKPEGIQKEKQERKEFLDQMIDKNTVRASVKDFAFNHAFSSGWLNPEREKETHGQRYEYFNIWINDFITYYENEEVLFEPYFQNQIEAKVKKWINKEVSKMLGHFNWKKSEKELQNQNNTLQNYEKTYKEKGSYSQPKRSLSKEHIASLRQAIETIAAKNHNSIQKTFISAFEAGKVEFNKEHLSNFIYQNFKDSLPALKKIS